MIWAMGEHDSAFLWESEALRSASARSIPVQRTRQSESDETNDWMTLREASEVTGIPVPTLRKWARRDNVESYVEGTPLGQLRMVSLAGVLARADQLGREVTMPKQAPKRGRHAEPRETAPAQPETAPAQPETAERETPPGTMLVPIDAWDKMLLQLGNLHEAGQQLAEARERAGKAETEAKFLRERLAELRTDLADAKKARPTQRRPVVEPTPSPPIAHIRIESADDIPDVSVEEDRSGADIPVRDLGRTGLHETTSARSEEDDGLSLASYTLEVARHLYTTWRGRPKR